jgi:hypothetical protein
MSFTAEDLAAIERALAEGTVRVRYADREVTYRSVDELVRLRNLIAGEIKSTGSGIAAHYPTFSKGLT